MTDYNRALSAARMTIVECISEMDDTRATEEIVAILGDLVAAVPTTALADRLRAARSAFHPPTPAPPICPHGICPACRNYGKRG